MRIFDLKTEPETVCEELSSYTGLWQNISLFTNGVCYGRKRHTSQQAAKDVLVSVLNGGSIGPHCERGGDFYWEDYCFTIQIPVSND